MWLNYIKLSILATIFLVQCNQKDLSKHAETVTTKQNKSVKSISNGPQKYDFNNPTDVYVLSSKLNEISSLSFDLDKKYLLTNDDESGNFYWLDPSNGNILDTKKFGKGGDYEAIEKVDNEIIIAKSNGNLYTYNLESNTSSKQETSLSADNNIEGLSYDVQRHILLLAAKAERLDKEAPKKTKAIYSFDLESKTLSTKPYLIIKLEELSLAIDSLYGQANEIEVQNMRKNILNFSPSGIAIHPNDQDIYIVSARGSTLIVFDNTLSLQSIVFLNSKTIPQPEGICFDDKGDLYIGTEGQKFSGKIFKYSPI